MQQITSAAADLRVVSENAQDKITKNFYMAIGVEAENAAKKGEYSVTPKVPKNTHIKMIESALRKDGFKYSYSLAAGETHIMVSWEK